MSNPTYTKVSEIAVRDLVDYLRLPELDSSEITLLTTIIEAAKNYVYSYTGQTAEAVDLLPDCSLAVYCLCQDMFDNRTMYVDKANINETVATILGMYRINLL